jgi:hypothetical protein
MNYPQPELEPQFGFAAGAERIRFFNNVLNILDIHECFGPWHLLKIFI